MDLHHCTCQLVSATKIAMSLSISCCSNGVQNIDIRDVEGRTPLQMAVRCGNAQDVKKLVDLGADFSVVKADEKAAVELERLYYEAKNVERKKRKSLRGYNRCHYCFRYRNSLSVISN